MFKKSFFYAKKKIVVECFFLFPLFQIFIPYTRFFIRNQFVRNLHVEFRKIKKLLELHYMTIFQNKKLFSYIFTISFSVAKSASHHRLSKRSHYIAEKKTDSNSKSNVFISQVRGWFQPKWNFKTGLKINKKHV